jgi:hypothetical protein
MEEHALDKTVLAILYVVVALKQCQHAEAAANKDVAIPRMHQHQLFVVIDK